MSDLKVERVATALFKWDLGFDGWDNAHEQTKVAFREGACAVIAALKEPSE